MKNCTGCKLHRTRRMVVVGKGNIPAKVMIIGEIPSKTDELLGTANMGPIGNTLTSLLQAAGINPTECFYTNTILCRPTDTKGGETRDALPEEIASCRENILNLYDQCSPQLVVLCGDLPQKYFKKFFPSAVKIQSPSLLMVTGGKTSPYYIRNVNALEEGIERIKNG